MSEVRKSITSPKGTELPILNLKGKEYLAVAQRLVLFREANPTGVIKTSMLALAGEGQDEYCIFKSEIYVSAGVNGSQMIASAHKRESRRDFPDFIEKCETSATGRALTLAGYGLQFVGDELDEKDRLADAPVEVISKGSGPAIVPDVTATPARSSFRKNVTPMTNGKGASDDGI